MNSYWLSALANPQTPRGRRSLPVPELTHAAPLTDSFLLLAAAISSDEPGVPSASLVSTRGAMSLESGFVEYSAQNGNAEDGTRRLLLVLLPHDDLEDPGDTRLAIVAGEDSIDMAATDLEPLVGDIGTLVRRVLAPLDAPGRERALAFLASTIDAVPRSERYELSETLHGIREAIRERLPQVVLSEKEERRIHVDRIMATSDNSFYVEGWLRVGELLRLTAVAPEGGRRDLLAHLFRHPRPGVADFSSLGNETLSEPPGFICFFELDHPSLRADGWVLELESGSTPPAELRLPPVLTDPLDVRDAVLSLPYVEGVPDDELMSSHVVPAINRLQERIGTEPRIESVTQFGTRPAAAAVSVVVPLYLQLEHLEIQLSQFVHDPDFREADLVYVLDSPQQREELLHYAADLYPIYGVPFRVAVLERNYGFAGASNAGAALAEGRLLLLLNSDVLPDRPGWLSRMRDTYDGTPKIGALGPKLLYEDDSIQHAGMYFHRRPGSDKWVDGHYFKGMHRSLPQANVARAVPAVSGSCLMIDRALYASVGGLSPSYLQGDYEDSDLCLKLWQEERENWYLPEVELYHLEGQSYTANVRLPANRYNMWLHNRLWGERIAELMSSRFAGEGER
jgi:GT2 family glycosyltransferase